MLKKLIILIATALGISVGALLSSTLINYDLFTSIGDIKLKIICMVLTSIIFLVLSLLLSDKFVVGIKKIEEKLSSVPIQKIILTTIGLILGLLVALLISVGVDSIVGNGTIGKIIDACLYIVFGYLGSVIGYKRGGEIFNIFGKFNLKSKEKEPKKNTIGTSKNVIEKVVDTSALIDSRIHDIAKTGFLEGKIIVPEFVLKELQLISDSEDPLKRAKGRLGLDCVEELKNMKGVNLEIDNKYSYNEHKGVDNLLINYALKYKCAIITTDYNLNKLATLQSIKVLNVNDLSNAVKPMLSTGERLKVKVLREGKENNQGIAYTEDGTMIVVENGKKYLGKDIDVEVQSVLQTSSGRIIFTKII